MVMIILLQVKSGEKTKGGVRGDSLIDWVPRDTKWQYIEIQLTETPEDVIRVESIKFLVLDKVKRVIIKLPQPNKNLNYKVI